MDGWSVAGITHNDKKKKKMTKKEELQAKMIKPAIFVLCRHVSKETQ